MSGSPTPPDAEAPVTIVNRRGLHARASAKFVAAAATFAADITVTKDGTSVCGTSIMGLMMLAAATGETIVIQARGTDAARAVDALVDLVQSKFGEDRDAQPPAASE